MLENANRLITVTTLSESNPRKLLCLWFHLASAGQVDLLMKKAICNLTFLKAYIAAFSLQGAILMLNACHKILELSEQHPRKEIEAVRDCLVFSFDILQKESKALGIQILGQLRGLRDENGRPMPFVEALCQQCVAAEDKNVFFTLVPTAACFLSSQGEKEVRNLGFRIDSRDVTVRLVHKVEIGLVQLYRKALQMKPFHIILWKVALRTRRAVSENVMKS